MIDSLLSRFTRAWFMLLVISLMVRVVPDAQASFGGLEQNSSRYLQSDPPVVLSLPELTADPGEELDIELAINTTAATRAIQFILSFNPEVLRCDSVNEGTFYSDWAAANGANTLVLPSPTCDNNSGKITIMGITLLGGEGGPSGDGVVASVRFTTLADGISPLTLSEVIVADASPVSTALETTIVDGKVTVGEAVELEDTVLRVSPPGEAIHPGRLFDVNIDISTVPPTRGVQFGMQFDPIVLRCEAISVGPFYNDWGAAHDGLAFMIPVPLCDNNNGLVTVLGIVLLTLKTTEPGGPSGEGIVARVTFTALEEGNSPINLTDVVVADTSPASQALPTSVINGRVNVRKQFLYLPIIIGNG